jgi:hypothetical protein
MSIIRDLEVNFDEIDDAFQILKEKRAKEKDFVELLAITLDRMICDASPYNYPPSGTQNRDKD